MQIQSKLSIFFTILLLSISFTSNNLLQSSYMFSFYTFIIAVCVLFIGFLFKQIFIPNISFRIHLIHLSIFVWVLYVFIRSFYFNSWANSEWALYIACFAVITFLGSLVFYFHTPINSIYIVIVLFSILQSTICIAQAAGVSFLSDYSNTFLITGTLENPNSTAMFLAISFPAAIASILNNDTIRIAKITITKKQLLSAKICFTVCIVLTIIALKCRTAYIGLVLSSTLFFIWYYRNKIVLYKRYLYISIPFLLVLTIFGLYFFKIDSAIGRLYIWKISYHMFIDKPLFGFGYGMFERNYNLYQAEFFENAISTNTYYFLAQHIHFAYNEYIQSAVEGGILGLLLFLIVIATLVFYSVKILRNQQSPSYVVAASCGVLAFVAMSFVNYTFVVIPVIIVLAIYISVIVCYFKNDFVLKFRCVNWYTYAMVVTLLLTTVFIASKCMAVFYHRFELQKHKNEVTINSSFFENKYSTLKTSPLFLEIYAKWLYNNKDYQKALCIYNKATLYNTTVSTYTEIGKINEELGNYIEAEDYYLCAINQIPTLYRPRMALFHFYKKTGQTLKAKSIAQIIVNMPVKIPSNYITKAKIETENFVIQPY